MNQPGQITLVGAGPGDPDLISVKGVKAIASAEVILYDALVHSELLKYAPTACQKVYVGKRAGQPSATQQKINELIVAYALSGKQVVRLKGGDPFIFARGQEEADYAKSFGLAVEVVIGISSLNLPGYYGIPLTTRATNQSFWVVTATNRHGKLSQDARLATQSSATVVYYMGLKKLAEIVGLYKLQNKHNLPVAIISQGSLPEAQVVRGTVRSIEKLSANLPGPAIIVAGESVGELNPVVNSLIPQAHAL
jgi:uroporphyrin-III C-methyltransferase